ncbi:alpha/beta hydrolase [Halalkalibacter kiskunsagensis]|uniref:Alpha/beta hydrolase n=1 Tax=Halalkalibacter kiskunsagensis TaxID=1548599 RepID=A0ABV6K8J2_9BACI
MTEKEVQFGKSNQIFGTLTYPETSPIALPAILLVAGSGPIDRNGNGKGKGQLFHLYDKLAAFLTDQGFITLRYDKRGIGKSEGVFGKTGFWDLVHDAKAAIHYLKQQPIVDRNKIFLLGHSEGCLLAPEIEKGEDLAGLVLIAGAGQTLEEALGYQRGLVVRSLQEQRGVKGMLLSLLKVAKKAEKQGVKFDEKVRSSKKDVIRYQGAKIPAKWFREHYQYNVLSGLSQVTCPILAVTGSKDVQATPEKVHEITSYTNVDTETRIIVGMNHMLRDQADDAQILQIKKAYKNIGEKPLSPAFLEVLKKWLNRHV